MSRFIKRNKVGLALLLMGFGLIWVGVLRKEIGVVWMKAVRICFECIGIG